MSDMISGGFSAREAAAATGGHWTADPGELFFPGVFTDTRQAGEGRLFLALAGEKFDAHDFLDAAIAAGSGALCVAERKREKIPANCPIPVLLTEDPLRAYQALARMHRMRFPALRLAAVTGSVGKTSVKEMLRAIFFCRRR